MARIAGIDLPRNKRVEIALQYIVGIGPATAKKVLHESDVDQHTRTDALTEEQIGRIRRVIDQTIKVEGDVRREVGQHIKRLMDLGTHRGYRHRRGLPVRGQRTRTNSRTRKGPRSGAIPGKKKVTKK